MNIDRNWSKLAVGQQTEVGRQQRGLQGRRGGGSAGQLCAGESSPAGISAGETVGLKSRAEWRGI